MTAAEYRALQAGDGGKKPRAHKYGAKSKTIDGHKFPSLAEADRYEQLLLLVRAGAITGLKLQPKFLVSPPGAAPIVYVADFQYKERGRLVVEDVKGVATPVYNLKKKLFKALHPHVDFRELRRSRPVRRKRKKN